jgi:hypothetical protein
MTYLRPDKKGLGLDVPGADEPSSFPGRADTRPRRWWLAGRSLAGSLVACVCWTGLSVFRLVEIVTRPGASATDWLVLVLSSLLALASVPSIVFFARSRHRRATAVFDGNTSEPNDG